MLRQEVLDGVADGEAGPVIAGARRRLTGVRIGSLAFRLLAGPGQDRLGAPPREERREGLRILLLQPGRGLRRIGELTGNPGGRLIDAGFLDVLPAQTALAVGGGLLLGDPPHLVGVLEVGRDLPLLERPLDRLDHHLIGLVGGDDQHLFARLQDPHPLALQAGLIPYQHPGGGHEVVDRFRRPEIRRPSRRGILLARRGPHVRRRFAGRRGLLAPSAAGCGGREGADPSHPEPRQ